MGYQLAAVANNQDAAESLSVNSRLLKIKAMAISSLADSKFDVRVVVVLCFSLVVILIVIVSTVAALVECPHTLYNAN
jgi:hypothetical protein